MKSGGLKSACRFVGYIDNKHCAEDENVITEGQVAALFRKKSLSAFSRFFDLSVGLKELQSKTQPVPPEFVSSEQRQQHDGYLFFSFLVLQVHVQAKDNTDVKVPLRNRGWDGI